MRLKTSPPTVTDSPAVTGSPKVTRERARLAVDERWLKAARWLWFGAAGIAFAALIVAVPGYLQGLAEHRFIGANVPIADPTMYERIIGTINAAASMFSALLSLGLAALIFWRRSNERMGLFLAYFLMIYGIVMAGPLEALDYTWAGASQFALDVAQPFLLAVPTILLICVFPNGRLEPRWTRWIVVYAFILIPIVLLLPPYSITRDGRFNDASIAAVVWVSIIAMSLYTVIYRYRNLFSAAERQQTKVVIYGFTLWVIVMSVVSVPFVWRLNNPGLTSPLPWWLPLSSLGWWLSVGIMPTAFSVAILHYHLWDIDVIINRTVVYGSLTTLVIAIYVLIVGTLSTIFQAQGNTVIALMATGLVAVLFQPLRHWLQQTVNRFIYGERDDPVTVLSRLAARLESAIRSEEVLPGIVTTVAEALKIPYAAIELAGRDGARIVAEYGRPQSGVERFPLNYRGERVGGLLAASRAGEGTFNPADLALLRDVARHAGTAVHAVALTAALQQSRRRLVNAREEERRRLRRDLHDGLGPNLASHMLKVGLAQDMVEQNPAMTAEILGQLEEDLASTLQDVRRIVYGLRPPELDQLGLVGAIEKAVEQYGTHQKRQANEPALEISLLAPELLPPLPAAVEIAAYRIVQESLLNVSRHARASTCRIQLSVDRVLQLTIADNGVGLPAEPGIGVGLTSIRERVSEVGGKVEIGADKGGGTKIAVELPLRNENERKRHSSEQ